MWTILIDSLIIVSNNCVILHWFLLKFETIALSLRLSSLIVHL